MDGKPEPDPAETLVLDDDEIAKLDDSSLTGIIRDASTLNEMLDADADPPPEIDDPDFEVLESDD